MKTRIIMVRHGQSESNEQLVYTGVTDVKLTEVGKSQAQLCAKHLAGMDIDTVYTSPLKRAKYTAVLFSRLTGLPFTEVYDLREMDGGDWEGISLIEARDLHPEEFGIWVNDFGKVDFPNGESTESFSKRLIAAVKAIAEENKGKTVLLTVHATPIRVITAAARKVPISEISRVPWARNSSLNIFDYEDGEFTEVETDITDHLGELTVDVNF